MEDVLPLSFKVVMLPLCHLNQCHFTLKLTKAADMAVDVCL